MTDEIKFIIAGVNEALGLRYDLIKFDALDEPRRLQLLADLLASLGAGEKLDVADDDPEHVSVSVLQMLANVKYRPPSGAEPARVRRALLQGDAAAVHHALHWLLANKEAATKTAYLAKYLKTPEVPGEVAQQPSLQELLQQHRALTEEFVEAHKRTRTLQQDSSAEIINDIQEMAVERDIVIKRLENVQVNLQDVSNKEELLSVGRELRLQQERAKELTHQLSSQQQQLRAAGEQLQRSLSTLRQAAAPATPAAALRALREEMQLNKYLAEEKLPAAAAALRRELALARAVAAEPAPPRAALHALQDKITAAHGDVERLVARRLAAAGGGDDRLAPFRQQAAALRRGKDASADRAAQLQAELRDREAALADLTAQVRQLLGDVVLRGDELKAYVGALRAKGVIYKRQRATLSAVKVEGGVLARTLHVIGAADPTVEMALVNHKRTRVEDEEAGGGERASSAGLRAKSLHDLSQLVAQTAARLAGARRDIRPMAERVRPLRARHQGVQQQHERARRAHDAAAVRVAAQLEPLRKQIEQLSQQLAAKEEEWAAAQRRLAKAERQQEAVAAELAAAAAAAAGPRRASRLEQLRASIADMEQTVKELEEEQQELSSRRARDEAQSQLWQRARSLLAAKLSARAAAAAAAAAAPRVERAHFTRHAQTLTLS